MGLKGLQIPGGERHIPSWERGGVSFFSRKERDKEGGMGIKT